MMFVPTIIALVAPNTTSNFLLSLKDFSSNPLYVVFKACASVVLYILLHYGFV